ncbi:hypothetical protein ACOL20_09985 [Aliarcobacter butzleri]|uniref:hypothetical protein n=1 Tax=Aliarcobacter butzleri TaxID=28197 RepID=UPI002B24654D|nr:hypothetical protein [Aliarcobacter butzleri]
MENKYNNFTFNEIVREIYANKDMNNIDIANKMADILNFSFKYFFEEIAVAYDTNITIFYRYKYSTLEKTPFEYFNQKVKNTIYKKFIKNINLKSFISLKCLELMQSNFGLYYSLYGPTIHEKDKNSIHFITIGTSIFKIYFQIEEFYKILTSEEYLNLFETKFPKFIEEYNHLYNKQETISVNNIDILFQPLRLDDEEQVIKYIYNQPYLYKYLSKFAKQTKKSFWIKFLINFKCTGIKDIHIPIIEKLIKGIIEVNLSEDRELFFSFIGMKKKSHFTIYFSEKLKEELRNDFNKSILCYKNCCTKYKKDVKKMLGPSVTSTKEFKYLFG